MKSNQTVVWSLFVRLTHWLVAILIFIEWFNETGYWHRVIGYICISLVMLRLVNGFISTKLSSKFYWPNLQMLSEHVSSIINGKDEEYQGHNPLGQWAVYCMWSLILGLAFTGWLSRTDAYWGEDWPVLIHQGLSSALMIIVVLHVVAVCVMSYLNKRNLLKQMLTGKTACFLRAIEIEDSI